MDHSERRPAGGGAVAHDGRCISLALAAHHAVVETEIIGPMISRWGKNRTGVFAASTSAARRSSRQ